MVSKQVKPSWRKNADLRKIEKETEQIDSPDKPDRRRIRRSVTSLQDVLEADVEKRVQAKPRKRKVGGGRKPILKSLADKLLFILVYFKTYPLQEVQGTLFGMSQGQANDWIQRLTPILQAALKEEALLPEREPANLEQVLGEFDLLEFTIDGTERRRQRPKENVEQKEYYSGKKSPYLDQ